ncbi:MAG: hypothetical protein ABS949_14430 [Solibacillus sp.]
MFSIKVGIVGSEKAYLPEINAYIDYLQKNDIDAQRVHAQDFDQFHQFDVIWRFPGLDYKKTTKDVAVVHEYNSRSIGKFGRLKDCMKKYINIQPQGRVFLNEQVRQQFNFNDQVPSITRDMGIDASFFKVECAKEYDFVYIGDMTEHRQLDNLLASFRNSPYTILMIGTPNDQLFHDFKHEKNIIFTGSVPYKEVPLLAAKAVYGINYIPNRHPYNEQTSTKLLEYCALNLKIVTTDYSWARQFEQQERAAFYKIDTLQKIDFDALVKYEYNTPNVERYEWSKVLDSAGLLSFLAEITKN